MYDKVPPTVGLVPKKLWRMKYLEWMIIWIIVIVFDSSSEGLKEQIIMLLMTPIAGLVLSKMFGLFVVGLYKLIALFTGFGIFRSFAELIEAVGKINERILANFYEDKPKYDPDYDD